RIVPVGVNPNVFRTVGSIAVPLAPVSSKPWIWIGLGIGCPAACSADARGTLTPTNAVTIGPLGRTCSVKCGTALADASFGSYEARDKMRLFNRFNAFDQKRLQPELRVSSLQGVVIAAEGINYVVAVDQNVSARLGLQFFEFGFVGRQFFFE